MISASVDKQLLQNFISFYWDLHCPYPSVVTYFSRSFMNSLDIIEVGADSFEISLMLFLSYMNSLLSCV